MNYRITKVKYKRYLKNYDQTIVFGPGEVNKKLITEVEREVLSGSVYSTWYEKESI